MDEAPTELGRLAENILHFARALRRAGLPIGPGRAADAVRAVEAAGFTNREDFFWVLQSCLVSRPEQRAVFAAAFDLFWRSPDASEQGPEALPAIPSEEPDQRKKAPGETRARDALLGERPALEKEIEAEALGAFSDEERLRRRDFEQMTASEIAEAKRALAKLVIPAPKLFSRRAEPSPQGRRPDWRATFRAAFRTGGQPFRLERRAPRPRPPALVALADVSGSMSGYSRMLLHLLHALSARAGRRRDEGWARVESFVFGTRLTRITRHLQHRDVDEALAAAGREAEDWEGGTRIGDCLEAFNKHWSRRLLSQGAVVLLITDGLDRGNPEKLARQAERLRLSCRKLIWLNPLLRWEGFAPRAQGARALLPQVDSFRSAHNIESLAALADALSRPEDAGEKKRLLEARHERTDP